ncbi:MAG: hypothetical protein BZY79_02810 [SAR202 cluster bacterium Casp-Chloro-G4]|nr:hypothetical protein [Chloroflexota bacterium]MDA1228225.1 hypothetical protein [Chloroflexota bacterium]PKB61627.1 MAG: hypothetical protein BZY79_02810 [SAR202 cluster bacterium Casp-Chloro-G4]
MKWLYLTGGALGAVFAFVYMMIRTLARFRTVAEAIGSTDLEWNVLLVVGGSAGILMIPVGIGFGLIVAAVVNLVMLRLRIGLYSGPDDTEGGSWVTHRDQAGNSLDRGPQ